MPNNIKNKLELLGPIEDIDALIKRFSSYVPAKIAKTYDDDLVICKSKTDNFGYCWMDLTNGYVKNREGLSRIGLSEEYEIEVKDSFLCFPDFEKIIPPPNDGAYRDLPSQAIAESSPNWWRTWNIENWGTKWSGYSYERPAINQFSFETAWAPVPKLIDIMSREFPTVTIKYTWADEDTGYNCGKTTYHNGILITSIPKGGTKDAYEIAFELRPDLAENYELVNGKYEYKEEE
jgi:hypothetical protein